MFRLVSLHFKLYYIVSLLLILAELRRAKRASGEPWVIKFGKPSIPENLVMT